MKCQLYRHFDRNGKLLYVGVSCSALLRMAEHKEASKWFTRVATVKIKRFKDRVAALAAERVAIRTENPKCNIVHASSIARSWRDIHLSTRQSNAVTWAKHHGIRLNVLYDLAAKEMPKTFARDPGEALRLMIYRQVNGLSKIKARTNRP